MDTGDYCDNSDPDSENSIDSNEDFTDIAMYFDVQKFDELSLVEKKSYRAQKLRYEQSRIEFPQLPIQPPNFMLEYSKRVLKRKQLSERSAAKKARLDQKKEIPVVPKRASGRLREATAAANVTITDPEVDDGPDFDVKIYFTPSEWSGMPLIVKRHAQNALEDYQNAQSKGIDMAIPKFMNRGNNETAQCSGSQNALQDSAVARKSQFSVLNKGSEALSSSKGFEGAPKDNLPVLNKDLPGCSSRSLRWSSLPKSKKSSPLGSQSSSCFNAVDSQKSNP